MDLEAEKKRRENITRWNISKTVVSIKLQFNTPILLLQNVKCTSVSMKSYLNSWFCFCSSQKCPFLPFSPITNSSFLIENKPNLYSHNTQILEQHLMKCCQCYLERKIKLYLHFVLQPNRWNTTVGGKFMFIILLSIRQFRLDVTRFYTKCPDQQEKSYTRYFNSRAS